MRRRSRRSSAGSPRTASTTDWPRLLPGTRRTATGGSRSRPVRRSQKPPGNRRVRSRPSRYGREHKELIDRSYPGASVRATFAAILVLLLLAVSSASAQQPPVSSYGEAVFVVSGRGYGHGVGMSQYGAYGQALAGRTYDQILSYYYTGTQIGKAGRKELRVLLAEGRRAVTISSSVPFTAVDATGATYSLPKGPLTLRPDLTLPSDAGPVQAVQPLVLRPGKKAPLALDGRLYRGKFELVPQDGFVRVVNVVPL